jgi:hypothetical protein
MITSTSRTLLASFAFTLAAGCATDPTDDMMSPDPTEEPTPDMPDRPVPAAGALDATFGNKGIKQLGLGSGYASSLVAQNDKLLVCATIIDAGANWVIRIARLDAHGDLDPTFATDGILEIPQTNYNVTCRSLAVRDDGSFVVAGRVIGQTGDAVNVWSMDGKTRTKQIGFSGQISKASAGSADSLFSFGTRSGNALAVTSVSDSAQVTSIAPPAVEGSITRTFERPGIGRIAVGSFGQSGNYYWGILQQSPDDAAKLTPGDELVQSAGGTANLMTDAIELPDGSLFAVGAVGTGEAVMVARFELGASTSATHHEHARGAGAMAYGVALDGEGRPVVVGSANVSGRQVFGWQRYEATSTTLDTSYQKDGLAALAPPSGQGELTAVARLGGKLYLLGQYDVETAEPKLALVRIHE